MLQNTQKSVAFLYTNNERSEREIQEITPFTISLRRISRNKPTEGDTRPIL